MIISLKKLDIENYIFFTKRLYIEKKGNKEYRYVLNLLKNYYMTNNNKIHFIDNQPYIRYTKEGYIELIEYYFYGLLHNLNGPAIINYIIIDGESYKYKECYYINGEQYSKQTYDRMIKNI